MQAPALTATLVATAAAGLVGVAAWTHFSGRKERMFASRNSEPSGEIKQTSGKSRRGIMKSEPTCSRGQHVS